ncbi:MAG: leucine-rich repeat domain-containing protein [Phaeodactylibacter sp.]|nr:leucine-rich repeat domain-containing protein [Phaeodactylibacter sp.]
MPPSLQNLKISFFGASGKQDGLFPIQPGQLHPGFSDLAESWAPELETIKKYCSGFSFIENDNLFVKESRFEKVAVFLLLSSDCIYKNNSVLNKLLSSGLRKDPDYYYPIITIGDLDIANLFETEQANALLPEKNSLDTRLKFLDSGIWHRYIQRSPTDEKFKFEEQLKNALNDLCLYHDNNLYHSIVARATLEFHLRLLDNSRIAPVGKMDHKEKVTPFKFHSETKMKQKAQEIEGFFLENFGKGKSTPLRWRFLMVDDYASYPLSPVSGAADIQIVSKKDWVGLLLDKFQTDIEVPRPTGEKKPDYKGATRDIIKHTLSMMRQRTYDILLLDYLLGPAKRLRGKKEREYGSDFLNMLQEDNKESSLEYHRGPMGRFWIFPISSFPFAFPDKLRQLGLDSYTGLWHLSGGGDPVSSPYLFRYYLLKFMQQQIMEYVMDDKMLSGGLRPFSRIEQVEIWAGAIEKKLGQLVLQSIILENEAHESAVAESMVDQKLAKRFKDFIFRLRELMRLLNAGVRNYDALTEFEARWQEIQQNKYYPATINLLSQKFNQLIFHNQKLATEKTEASNGRRLVLSDMHLLKIPDSLRDKANIRELWLNGNRLEFLPDWLGELKNLEKIYLTHNNFYLFPAPLLDKRLKKLRYIDLRHNQIKIKNTTGPRPGLATTRQEVSVLLAEAQKMMESTQGHLETIRELIENEDVKAAAKYFERLNQEYKNKGRISENTADETSDFLTLLINRINQLYRAANNGLISNNDYAATLSQITHSLLKESRIYFDNIPNDKDQP